MKKLFGIVIITFALLVFLGELLALHSVAIAAHNVYICLLKGCANVYSNENMGPLIAWPVWLLIGFIAFYAGKWIYKYKAPVIN